MNGGSTTPFVPSPPPRHQFNRVPAAREGMKGVRCTRAGSQVVRRRIVAPFSMEVRFLPCPPKLFYARRNRAPCRDA